MDVTGRNGNIKISCNGRIEEEILYREEGKLYEINYSDSLLQ